MGGWAGLGWCGGGGEREGGRAGGRAGRRAGGQAGDWASRKVVASMWECRQSFTYIYPTHNPHAAIAL
jgi:hypothetical protein